MTYTLTQSTRSSSEEGVATPSAVIRVHLPTITSIAGDRVIVEALEGVSEVHVQCTGLLPLEGLRVPVPCAPRSVKARFSRMEATLTLEVHGE